VEFSSEHDDILLYVLLHGHDKAKAMPFVMPMILQRNTLSDSILLHYFGAQ